MQDSIQNNGGGHGAWQTVDEIVVPSHAAEPLVPVGMKTVGAVKPASVWKPVHSASDSTARARRDSVIRAVNDSLAKEKSGYGIVLQAPYREHVQEAAGKVASRSGDGLSWVFVAMAVIFCAVCLKLKNTPRYIKILVSDMKDVRTRHNMFDNTVKETSFLLILIIGWICSVGVLLWDLLRLTVSDSPFGSFGIPDSPLCGIGLCAGVAAVYVIFMLLSYEIVGNVFSDRQLTRLWVKGATALMGLQSFMFFPLALLSLCYAEWGGIILILAGIVFVFGKIQFIYKGFRIFFNQMSSWLLFLYYLCSLEIVPLILTYLGAVTLCTVAY